MKTSKKARQSALKNKKTRKATAAKSSVKGAAHGAAQARGVSTPKRPASGAVSLKAASQYQADVLGDVRKNIEDVISNSVFVDYMSKNVGRRSIDMVQCLNETAQTDDKLALKLSVKVNEVRRMLNVLNSYSITRYDINKDSKGWLTFKWYLDRDKLRGFNIILNEKEHAENFKLQDNCNDFFFCKSCYKDQKVILPFDAAFEISFKCECGAPLSVLSKEEATALFKEENALALS